MSPGGPSGRAGWLWADWPAPPGVRAGVSTRSGGVSAPPWASLNLGLHVGDRPEAVLENRRRLRETLALPGEPVWLAQVHGTAVFHAPGPAGVALPEADAVVTDRPGVVCAVMTADCLSVVLAERTGERIGVAHAGWRGLAAGVLETTVAAFGAPPGRLVAWLGPCISQAFFEVGEEVREAFVGADPGAAVAFAANPRGRWQADLEALASRRLAACGVAAVHGGGRCSYREQALFHSHRRDGPASGRMVTLAWRDA